MQDYLAAFRKYAVFTGRSRRKEYWGFFVVNLLVILLLTLAFGRGGDEQSLPFPIILYFLVVLAPALGVGIRRLHDTDRTGWWMLVTFIPFIGGLVFLVFMLLPGTKGENRYGADPTQGAT